MDTADQLLHKADTFLHQSPVDTVEAWKAFNAILDLRNRIEYEKERVTQSRLFADFVISLFSFSRKRRSKDREDRFKYNNQLIQKALDVTREVHAGISLKIESHNLIREMCDFLEEQTLRVEFIEGELYLVTVYSNRRTLTVYEEFMYTFFDIIPRKW
jgi:hypothetical protein